MKRYACISMIISLIGLYGLPAIAIAESASQSIGSPSAIAAAPPEDNGPLRQGLPGRRLNGGTRNS